MGKHIFRIIVGLIIVLVGLAFLLDRLGIHSLWGIGLGDLWPVILIVLGGVMFQRRGPNMRVGIILAVLGIVFLASEILGWNIWSIGWPVLVIGLGIWILLKGRRGFTAVSGTTTSDSLHESILFQGVDRQVVSKNFTGGTITCTLGGFKIDLHGAQISPGGATLKVSCTFGGGEILIPQGARVVSEGSALFGGWNNRFTSLALPDSPVLKIEGSVFFGGVEVKH
jgi:predicted membrane protein